MFHSKLLLKSRSNVFYRWLVNSKNMNFRTFFQNKRITVYQKIIFGFQYFLDHLHINLHAFNDVLVVLLCYLFRCFSIFFITIKRRKERQRTLMIFMYRSALYISLSNKFVFFVFLFIYLY
jgi:hypothetical protein